MVHVFSSVTHLGTFVLLIPFCLMVALWLALRIGVRESLLWCICVAGVCALIALAKIYLEACGRNIGDIHSPSGHSAFSAIAYGGFTVIAAARSGTLRAHLFRLGMVLWVLLIGYSRVAVNAHSPGEVVAGLLIGSLGVAVFAALYRGRVRPSYTVVAGALALVLLIALLLPDRMAVTIEPWLKASAQLLYPYRPLICG